MADQYIKFRLTPGQSSPDDSFSTGICVSGDWLVWLAPEGVEFPINDPADKRPLEYKVMTSQEIEMYEQVLLNMKNPIIPPDPTPTPTPDPNSEPPLPPEDNALSEPDASDTNVIDSEPDTTVGI